MAQFPEDYYIVDVGMHDGKDSEYYARRGFNVIAFEANPELARQTDARFRQEGVDVDVRNRAIANGPDKDISFFVNRERSQWSSLNPEIGGRRGGADQVTVRSCSLARELADISNRIHMVKIDIEGSDLLALSQISYLKDIPPYISVENGGLPFLELMHEMGYSRFKYSNQKYVRFHWVPGESSHGHEIRHRFQDHSSGAFGEDLVGRWLTRDEAICVSNALEAAREQARDNLFAEAVGWFDLHAAL